MEVGKKAISLVWLSETDLTNLNSGIGGSNLVDIKRYKKDNVDYPYVSGQAMRHYLKEAIMRRVDKKDYCISDKDGKTCGDIKNCVLCDLFGFMEPIKKTDEKKGGSNIRVSPVKMSPAMGLLPFQDNSTLDLLTRAKSCAETKGSKEGGDIVNVELGVNIYKAGLSIDLQKIGGEEELDQKSHESKGIIYDKYVGNKDDRIRRVKIVLESFKNISDYSKQARLLTDFTPNILLIALQSKYNHLLQKALILKENKMVDTNRLKEVLTMLKGETIYAGILSGTIGNEEEVKKVLEDNEITIKTPTEAVDEIIFLLK